LVSKIISMSVNCELLERIFWPITSSLQTWVFGLSQWIDMISSFDIQKYLYILKYINVSLLIYALSF
jgi:hypothetical protein